MLLKTYSADGHPQCTIVCQMTHPDGDSSNWQRQLKITLAAQLTVSIGMNLIGPLMPLFIQQLGGFDRREAALWSGIMSGVSGAVMMFMGPIWGTLSDWFGHKRNVLRAISGTAIIIGLTSVIQNPIQLVISRMMLGAISGVFPAMQGLLGSVLPRAKLPLGIGLLQAVSSFGLTLGPLVGGLLTDRTSFSTSFIISGALIGAGGIVLLRVKEGFHPPPSPSHTPAQLVSNLKSILSVQGVRKVLFIMTLVQLAPNLVSPVFPLLLSSLAPNAGIGSLGLFFTLFGLATTTAAFASGAISNKIGAGRLLMFGCVLGGLGAFFMSIAGSIIIAIVIGIILAVATGVLVTTGSALLGSATPSNRQGSAFGLVQSANSIGFGFGPLIGGVIGSMLGLRIPFAFEAGVFGLLFLSALTLKVRKPE